VYIQQRLDQATIEDQVQLSVKIGIGVGLVSIIHIGGTYKRMEYLAVGDPLIQVSNDSSLHAREGGQKTCTQ
jgi:adenylate cyclase 10